MADSAAGLEAISKAAAPEVCLIKINAAAVLHNIAAYGSDITDLRRSCQRCRLRYSGAAFIHQLILRKLCKRHTGADNQIASCIGKLSKFRNLFEKNKFTIISHPVFQQRHNVRAAANVGGVLE